jgi:tricarballylate dehydrogenase
MYTENKTSFPDLSETAWDIIVIGAGNAGICAAITAAEAGCSVLVIEAAPKDMRGGNTRHTRNLRAMHDEPTDILTHHSIGDSDLSVLTFQFF